MKLCTGCQTLHPLERFSPDRRHGDGLQCRCKECRRVAQKELRQKHPEITKAINQRCYQKHIVERRAEKLAEYHSRPEYHKVRSRKWKEKNRDRANAWRRRWLANNPEQRARCTAGIVAWQQAHPEKVKEASARYHARKRDAIGTVSLEQWRELAAAYHYRCAYCRERPRRLERDHMMPLSRGGHDTVENVVPTCSRCNGNKGILTPLEWFLREAA